MREPGERVCDRLPGIGFDSQHNRAITWKHLLTQTSEWQGECFGMPDQVEHYRRVSHDPKPSAGRKGELRPLLAPGTYWEYNDVRINQLSLALLHLFKRPLPQVFLESVLQPIGGGRQVISREWVKCMQASSAVAPFYGWLTWLNRDGRLYADASRTSGFMFGAGGHMVWIDPDHEAVVVSRWLDGAHSAGFVRRVARGLAG